jgi:hypothetical protein
VLSFKPSERIQAAVASLGGRLLAAPSSAARAYENKLAFVGAAERAGVPRPFWHARRLPRLFAEMAKEYGERIVVQAARGNAGQRTWLVTDQGSLEAVAERAPDMVRVSEYIDGQPFTASGVAFSSPGAGLDARRLPAFTEPCRQLTGIPWLTPEPLGSCGNVWGEKFLTPHVPEVVRCVRALGADLAANNYRGVFGVDFVLSSEGPMVIEVNPRMVASLPLATHLDIDAGRAPLLLMHLLELLDADLDKLAAADGRDAVGPASQVILHRLPGDADVRPPGGVYRCADDGAPEFLRPGATLDDLHDDGEVLVLTRQTGEPISGTREFGRLCARSPAGPDHPGMRRLVDHLRHGG